MQNMYATRKDLDQYACRYIEGMKDYGGGKSFRRCRQIKRRNQRINNVAEKNISYPDENKTSNCCTLFFLILFAVCMIGLVVYSFNLNDIHESTIPETIKISETFLLNNTAVTQYQGAKKTYGVNPFFDHYCNPVEQKRIEKLINVIEWLNLKKYWKIISQLYVAKDQQQFWKTHKLDDIVNLKNKKLLKRLWQKHPLNMDMELK